MRSTVYSRLHTVREVRAATQRTVALKLKTCLLLAYQTTKVLPIWRLVAKCTCLNFW